MEKNIELYNKAKEAYYNGEEIMSDIEFDELEKSLGLENKSYVGAKRNNSYTIKHPYIMGSLSKVQIKEDSNGIVDWESYTKEINKYINRYHKDAPITVIMTPKYDGCSFECYWNGDALTISSRGDGYFGRDLYKHLINKVSNDIEYFKSKFSNVFCLRGEVLIDKHIFNEKYSEDFVNPRSFVAGILGRDVTEADKKYLDDLEVVIYDIREMTPDGEVIEYDIDEFDYSTKPILFYKDILSISRFESIYKKFEKFRSEYRFALDGFVIKPTIGFRALNLDDERPSDCVAIKFIPILEETEVVDIIWNSRKTNELIPTIKVKPVIMDGKEVSKASAHNYGYLISNKLSIGCKVILSLAGDIVPFIYKITDTQNFSEEALKLPECNTIIDGVHLLQVMDEKELTHKFFINSGKSLNIPGMGESSLEKIYEYVYNSCQGDEFFGIEAKEVPNNILLINSNDIEFGIGGKNGVKVRKEFENIMKHLTIKDIINSLCIEDCGDRISTEIEKYLVGGDYDFSHMAEKAYKWVFDNNSNEYKRFTNILVALNKTIDDFKEVVISKETGYNEQIPVILTGEPNNYASKAEFLKCNPIYRMTGSWKECQIVFTNSLESNTGKMKKAREKGIKIMLY